MSSRFPTHPDRSSIASPTSRRALLGALAVAPAALPVFTGSGGARALPVGRISEVPVILRRTRAGRDLSRARYRNAEVFFAAIEAGIVQSGAGLLYHTGIVMQLGLSTHLLDVGFDDQWCARHLGLHIDRSLTLANVTGLGLDRPQVEDLARFLSPYGQWRHADVGKQPDCRFAAAELRSLARMLLDHVRAVTGHQRWPHRSSGHGRA